MKIDFTKLITHPALLGPAFSGPSWDRWKAIGKAIYGEAMTAADITLFREVAGRDPPQHRVKEVVIAAGRSAGKDVFASAIATLAALTDWTPRLRPGEKATVMIIAVDRTQAKIAFDYIAAYFQDIPTRRDMVVSMGNDSIELSNRVVVEVHTNSYRSVRGRSIVCAIFDELAFWRDDAYANPDREVAGAVAPALGRMPGSMLVMISSVHMRSGLLFERWKKYYGTDDEHTLVIYGDTLKFNPTLNPKVIEEAIERDAQQARAEYLSEWRDDLSGFLDANWIENACTDRETGELAPAQSSYFCWLDPSGGRRDAMTMSIGHRDPNDRIIIDLVRGRQSPFDLESVVDEFADLMRDYGISQASSDRYAGEWVTASFAKRGITITPADLSKSDIYLEAVPVFARNGVSIPRDRVLLSELRQLERRTHRGARDSVDHPTGDNFHDDFANSCCGAIYLCAGMHGCAGWTEFYARQAAAAIPKRTSFMHDARLPGSLANVAAAKEQVPTTYRVISKSGGVLGEVVRVPEQKSNQRNPFYHARKSQIEPPADVYVGTPWSNFYIQTSRYMADESGWIRSVRREHVSLLPARKPPAQ